MIIVYGVNRRRPGGKSRKDREHQNGEVEVEGVTWEGDHRKIWDAIMAKHPGWAITGYCEKERGREAFSLSLIKDPRETPNEP